MKVYIGADLHARSVQLAAVNETGGVVAERSIPTDKDQLLTFVMKFAPDVAVAVEAMGSHYWLVDALDDAGIEVHAAHPLMLKAIAYAKVKTDKADAITIAQLLRSNMLPKSYVYPRELRPLRDLSRRRQDYVTERALHYRSIQNLHQQFAFPMPSRNAVKKITASELAALFPEKASKIYAGSLVTIDDCLSEQIEKIEKHLHEKFRKNIEYRRLMKIMGVGRTYGQIILLESGDVSRFRTHRHYASYARLVPGADNSGGKERNGHNPKQGNARLKNAFRQVALYAAMRDRTIKNFFERKLRVVHKKNIAYAIVARKLATGAYYVLKNNVAFDKVKLFGPEPRERNEDKNPESKGRVKKGEKK